jgi:nucleoside-diphosphate-sugar epimerase
MKVAITGASGGLGRTVQARTPAEWQARLIDRRDAGVNSADFHCLDLADLDALKRALEGVDAVIHLAAIPSPYHGNDEQIFRANVQGTYNLMLACEAHGIGRIVYASSICFYGLLFRREFMMPAYLPLDEEHPSRPQDGYSLSKRIGEEIMRAYVERAGGAVASLRYCYLAPEGSRKGVPQALNQ